MAFRSRTRRSGRSRAKRDLIWFTQVVEQTITDTAVGGQVLLADTEWNVAVSVSYDTAVLMRIVGWLGFAQTGNATSADNPWLGYAIYRDAFTSAALMDPTDTTSMNAHDILLVGGMPLASTASGTTALLQRHPIDITVKRKLNTSEVIRLVARIPADTATPTVNISGQLRCLVDRS